MAYRLKRKESVAEAIRRLACDRAEKAIDGLKDRRIAWGIHATRKNIKQARSLLKLVRTQISRTDYCESVALLRDAAKHLADSRDAYIRNQALKGLLSAQQGRVKTSAFSSIRLALEREAQESVAAYLKNDTARKVKSLLHDFSNRVAELKLDAKGWKALAPGLDKTYRAASRGYHTVLEQPGPANLHQWRKRCKDLWHQVRLLREIWPEQMDAVAGELKALGDLLGQDHDLVVLAHALAEPKIQNGHSRAAEVLRGLIEERHAELRAKALELGASFFCEPSRAFVARLHTFWKLWRRGKYTARLLKHQEPGSRRNSGIL